MHRLGWSLLALGTGACQWLFPPAKTEAPATGLIQTDARAQIELPPDDPEHPPKAKGQMAISGLAISVGQTVLFAGCTQADQHLRLVASEALEGPLQADGPTWMVVQGTRYARGRAEIALGLDGRLSVEKILQQRSFQEGDCGLSQPSAAHAPERVRLSGLKSKLISGVVAGISGQVSLPDAPVYGVTPEELLYVQIAAATHAYCDAFAGVHQVEWRLESSDHRPMGVIGMPCVEAGLTALALGQGPAQSWTFETDQGPVTASAPLGLLDTPDTLLALRQRVNRVSVACEQAPCPPGLAPSQRAAWRDAWTFRGMAVP